MIILTERLLVVESIKLLPQILESLLGYEICHLCTQNFVYLQVKREQTE